MGFLGGSPNVDGYGRHARQRAAHLQLQRFMAVAKSPPAGVLGPQALEHVPFRSFWPTSSAKKSEKRFWGEAPRTLQQP